jgi:hypothetical protein
MPPTLSIDAQTDFSAGAFQGVARHLIPRNGLYEAINSLLDDSGSIYKRGGSAYLSTAEAATNGLPLFLFDGYLSAGRRTFWADASAFGVLDGTDAPLNLGGGGVTGPRRGVVIGGVLIVDGKLYAGSLKTANYSTGTISVTQGSAVITGSGTTWNTLVDVGMLLQVAATGRYYVVKSVDSTTQITLTEAFEGSTGRRAGVRPVTDGHAADRAAVALLRRGRQQARSRLGQRRHLLEWRLARRPGHCRRRGSCAGRRSRQPTSGSCPMARSSSAWLRSATTCSCSRPPGSTCSATSPTT